MGKLHSSNYKKESNDENDEKYSNDLEEYKKLCKEYNFYEDNNITVKIKEKFGIKFSANYTLPLRIQERTPLFKKSDKKIKLIKSKSLYPHPKGFCGGKTIDVYIFEATK